MTLKTRAKKIEKQIDTTKGKITHVIFLDDDLYFSGKKQISQEEADRLMAEGVRISHVQTGCKQMKLNKWVTERQER